MKKLPKGDKQWKDKHCPYCNRMLQRFKWCECCIRTITRKDHWLADVLYPDSVDQRA